MIAVEEETTSWRLRETIRVRELAATHRLGQIRRLLMLEEQKVWKREAGFDCIETAAEMDARRSRSNVVSETFFFRSMSNTRRPHTPDEFTLEMKVEAELLRVEIIILQSLPRPQCDPSPRRLPATETASKEPGTLRRSPAVGTGSEEPGTLRRLPAIGTGSEELEVSRAQTSSDTEECFPLETSMDGFSHSKCTSP